MWLRGMKDAIYIFMKYIRTDTNDNHGCDMCQELSKYHDDGMNWCRLTGDGERNCHTRVKGGAESEAKNFPDGHEGDEEGIEDISGMERSN